MARAAKSEAEAAAAEEQSEETEERWLREPSLGSWWSLSTGLKEGDSRLSGWSGVPSSAERYEDAEG